MAFIVSLHIPKTAGTSLFMAFRNHFGPRLYNYNRNPELLAQVGAAAIRAQFDIVHGHINLADFAGHLDGATLITFLRDPVQRVVSSYLYHTRPQTTGALADRVRGENMTLEDFAHLPSQQDLQFRMTRPVPLDRFDYIGLSERLDTSWDQLSAVLGFEIRQETAENANPGKNVKDSYDLPAATTQLIRGLNPRDIALYETIAAA